MMSDSIIVPSIPIRTSETEWLIQYLGRISVAIETPVYDIVDIIAYSDNDLDLKELHVIAKKNGGYIIKNISKKGVDYIDAYSC